MSRNNTTNKQTLDVLKTCFVWNGFKYLLAWEIMLQPKGEKFFVIEHCHMNGDIIGRRFISSEEYYSYKQQTTDYLNDWDNDK